MQTHEIWRGCCDSAAPQAARARAQSRLLGCTYTFMTSPSASSVTSSASGEKCPTTLRACGRGHVGKATPFSSCLPLKIFLHSLRRTAWACREGVSGARGDGLRRRSAGVDELAGAVWPAKPGGSR
eukprot:351161-Chlamydomonas_euryale.AAC.4